MPSSSNAGAEDGKKLQPFQFRTIKEVYDTPDEQISYCVDNLLPTGGMSALLGKPKAGKTSLARQLAVAVAQGEAFLGRKTKRGRVLYLAIEEKLSQVKAHFRQLGLQESDPVEIACGSVQKSKAIDMLELTLQAAEDSVLVIIDPMFRFVKVSDANDYIQVNDILEKLLDVARKRDVHILTVHHMKKKETEDDMDGALGSTAIAGAVDTLISLKVDQNGGRIIATRQRYGTDMESTHLEWNPDSGEMSLGATSEATEKLRAEEIRDLIETRMLTYIAAHPGCDQESIFNAVTGKTTTKKQVFQSLKDKAYLSVTGSGKKGDPYRYDLVDSTIPV